MSALLEVAGVFLRFGFTAFGGPAAHIAMMENELVRRRKWLTHERFLDLLATANLIPGPSSTELAIYVGYERAGFLGLLVAGACFILPAAAIVLGLAWAYVRWGGALPAVGGVLYGVKPVVIAVIAQALVALAPKAVKSPAAGVLGILACAASALGVDPLVVLVSTGVLMMAVRRALPKGEGIVALGPLAAVGAASPVTLLGLFLAFLKMGAIVFGSGYVLVAFLRADLVTRLHWIDERVLLDAIAVGQVTPGPVFTTATFIGYIIGRVPGAVVATVGIFLPGFVLVAATRPLIARVRASPVTSAFLDGVNVASVALMAVVAVELGRAALVDAPTVAVAAIATLLLVRWKVNTTWLVLAGAIVGAALRR